MADILRSVTTNVTFLQTATATVSSTLMPFYGSVQKADNYFAYQLHCQRWNTFDNFVKTQALIGATRIINRLNYVGCVAVEGQPLQFPRGTDTLVPVEIEYAAYEIAYALLKGVDPNTERENLFTLVQGFGQARTEYRADTVKPWIIAGIPSAEAWDYLYPYINPREELVLLRG